MAILWHEQWHEALEEASRVYYTEKNPDGMIAILQPLHDQLEKVPQIMCFDNLSFADMIVVRDRKLFERVLSLRSLDGICGRLRLLRRGTLNTVTKVSLIKLGTSTMGYVYRLSCKFCFY